MGFAEGAGLAGTIGAGDPCLNATISQAQAARISELAKDLAGLQIDPAKTEFLKLRLDRRLRDLGLSSYEGYLSLLSAPGASGEQRRFVEALTTHTTSFFREARQFEWLQDTGLPAWREAAGRSGTLTLWSAACSTGAELWSAAMSVLSAPGAGAAPPRLRLIGSDISARILSKAASATFSETEIELIPEALRERFLLRSRSGPARYRIVPELTRGAVFMQLNLLSLTARRDIHADFAFLRNVLIYFSAEDQHRMICNVLAHIRPGGFLLTGHTEAIHALPPGLRQVAASIYQRI